MMKLITDRTESDSLLKNTKGRYTYADLNRVEQAVEAIMDLAAQMDISLDLETKTNWGVSGVFPENFPTRSQMQRYLSNIYAVRNSFSIPVYLPVSMNRLSWKDANNIEKVLQAALKIADQTIPNFRYCGELFAGEE